jgi:hypothetical protein
MNWNNQEPRTIIANITPLALKKMVKYSRKIIIQKEVIGNVSLHMLVKDYAIHFMSDSNETARLFYKLEDKERKLFTIQGPPICISFFDQNDFITVLTNFKNNCEANKFQLTMKISEQKIFISYSQLFTLASIPVDIVVKKKNIPEVTNDSFLIRLCPVDVKYLAGTKSDSDIVINGKTMVVKFQNGSYVIDSTDGINEAKMAAFYKVIRDKFPKEKMGNIMLSAKVLKFFKEDMGNKQKKKNYQDNPNYDINYRYLNFDANLEVIKGQEFYRLYIFKNKKDLKKNFTECSCYELLHRFYLRELDSKLFEFNVSSRLVKSSLLDTLEKYNREERLNFSRRKEDANEMEVGHVPDLQGIRGNISNENLLEQPDKSRRSNKPNQSVVNEDNNNITFNKDSNNDKENSHLDSNTIRFSKKDTTYNNHINVNFIPNESMIQKEPLPSNFFHNNSVGDLFNENEDSKTPKKQVTSLFSYPLVQIGNNIGGGDKVGMNNLLNSMQKIQISKQKDKKLNKEINFELPKMMPNSNNNFSLKAPKGS